MSVPAETLDLRRVFRRGFAATFAADIVTSLLGAITTVILIRGLSVSNYAYATLFLTFAQFAASAATSGVRTRYLREEAERMSRATRLEGSPDFVLSLLKGTLLVCLLAVVALPIANAAGFASDVGGSTALILYSTGFAIGYAAVEFAIAHDQAERRFLAAGGFRVARAAVLLVAAVAVITTGQSPDSISVWFVVSMLTIGFVTTIAPAMRQLSSAWRALDRLRFNGEEMWLSFYYVAAGGFAYVDVMVAGAMLTKHEVASLGASLRYLAIALAAIPALGAILRVRTAQVDVVDSPANQNAMVIGWLRRAALPAAVLMTISIVLAPFVIPLIDGGRYPSSIPTFQIFLVTAMTAYLTAPVANVLMAQRHYATLAAIYAVGLTLNLVGDIAVARPYGIVGIAVVSTAVYVCIDAAMSIAAVRYARSAAR